MNIVYVDASSVGSVTWSRVQVKLSHALKFFRDVWILNPHLNKNAAHELAKKLLQTHVKTVNSRKSFFTRYIAQIREKIAFTTLDEMGKNVVFAQNSDGTEFADPRKACDQIPEVLTHLGKNCKKASPRDCFEKLIGWYDGIPLNQKPLIKRFIWIDDVELATLPEEIKNYRKSTKLNKREWQKKPRTRQRK